MISGRCCFSNTGARIWYAMSRDGPASQTVFKSIQIQNAALVTWIACFAVGIPAGVVDIAMPPTYRYRTLFAFRIGFVGVIFLRRKQPDRPRAFRVPMVPLFR